MIEERFWAWTSVDANASTEEIRSRYRRLKLIGLDGVFVGGPVYDRDYEVIREEGLHLHTWMWTTNRGDAWIRENHPEWYMVSRSGKSCFDQPPYVDYYRWVSPVIPGVRQYLRDEVARIAAHPCVEGVHLDYVRYPDVILPTALWSQYGLDQTEELPDYDFSYDPATRAAFQALTGRDPLEIEDPAHDQEWLHFRYDTITSLVQELVSSAHEAGKKMTAAVFPTPSMARKICRQSWDKWPLDAVCPMVYHSFYNADVSWIGDCMRENIQSVRFPVIAGLYLPAFETSESLKEGIRLVKKRGGAGFSLFGELSDRQAEAIGEIISEW